MPRCAAVEDEGKVDLGLAHADDSSSYFSATSLSRCIVMRSPRRSRPFCLRKPVTNQVDDSIVEVLASEERVAAGRPDLEDAAADLEDRDVEGAAAEVVDGDAPLGVTAGAVGEPPRSAR